MSANLAHKLHEPHYWDGPDALHLLDLAVFPKAPRTEPEAPNAVRTDSLRHYLQARVPTSLLDIDGKTARELLKEDAKAGGSTYNVPTKFSTAYKTMMSNIQYRRNPRKAERHSCQDEIHAHLALHGLPRPDTHVSLRWHLPGCTYHCVGLRQKFVDLDISLDGRLRAGRGVDAAFGVQVVDAE